MSTTTKVTYIPFYGGAKGQSLMVIEKLDGTVETSIVKTPSTTTPVPTTTEEILLNITEVENPPLPPKQDYSYSENIRRIQDTALSIIKLQERAKNNGGLSEDEEQSYNSNMEILNRSAQKLANIQETEGTEGRENLSSWFDRKKENKKKQEEEKNEKEKEELGKEEENKEEEKEEEHNKKPNKEEEVGENEEEGIAVGLPGDDASIAEAKPVGLAVAGEGGVAASKPIATAVVGPGGLAVARPVGTAIAGVSPDQALVPIYAEGYVGGLKPKRTGNISGAKDASEYLNRIISKYHRE